MPVVERGGVADVVYVLCLMQASFLLLAGLGEMLMMGGSPAYLVVPVVKAALLFVVAAKVARHRKWALITLIVVQGITLVGFAAQVLLGAVPALGFSPSLVGLLTGLALPVALIAMCALVLGNRRLELTANRRAIAAVGYPYTVPQDPYTVPQDPYTGALR